MNRQEWIANGRPSTKQRTLVKKMLKEWKVANNIYEMCVVHHRDDDEVVKAYNETHYELWGFNEDGSFEYGKYVIFMTCTEHTKYHHKGKVVSEETRAKMSASQKGKELSEETRSKMSANSAWKGKERSEETRAKMSAAKKGRKLSEETRAKMSAAHQRIKILYTTYKNNGGTLNWREFCKALKNGEIAL